jgi:hypothetical protein
VKDNKPPDAIGKPVDDYPESHWLKITILPGSTPRAIRMRHWLKRGLRDYGIRVEAMPDDRPEETKP